MNQAKQVLLSPDRRYKRSSRVITADNLSTSFLGIDQDRGSEIVWTVLLRKAMKKDQEALIQRLFEINQLYDCNILKYKAIWKDSQTINIITEKPDTSLSVHSKRIPFVRTKLLKKWAKELLEIISGLQRLGFHTGITMDSFYVNTSDGTLKYGNIGVPEFQEADLLNDLWSFGIIVLELLGLDTNKPRQSLELVEDEEWKRFLELCMFRVSRRLSVSALLEDSIFKQLHPICKKSPEEALTFQKNLLEIL